MIARLTKTQPQLIAMLFALLAYTLLSTSDAMIKLAADEKTSTPEIMLFCGLFCVLILLLKALKQKHLPALIPISKRLVLLRTILGVATNFFFFTAYSHLPLANVYVIKFISPLIIATGAAVFLSEQLSAKKFLIVLFGFTGTYIAINPASLLSGSELSIGYLSATCGMLCFSTSQLLLRKLSQYEKPEAILFIGSSGYVVFGLAASLSSFQLPTPAALGFIFLSSAIGLSGWFLILSAFKRAPAAVISSIHYIQLIIGAALGYLIWHTIPEWNMFAGGAIIIASGLAMAHHTHKNATIPTLLESK